MQNLALTDTNRVAASIWAGVPATAFRHGYDGISAKMEVILDFSDSAKSTDLAICALVVPKGSVIIGVGYEIITAFAAAITANIGQYTVTSANALNAAIDADEYVATGAMDAAAGTLVWNAASGPVYGCTADVGINFTLSGADIVGKIRIFALVAQP